MLAYGARGKEGRRMRRRMKGGEEEEVGGGEEVLAKEAASRKGVVHPTRERKGWGGGKLGTDDGLARFLTDTGNGGGRKEAVVSLAKKRKCVKPG